MARKWKLLEDGGFVVGDAGSQLTGYAYPTSHYALLAKKYPDAIAEQMLIDERVSDRKNPNVRAYDRRNWMLIEGIDERDIAETQPPQASEFR